MQGLPLPWPRRSRIGAARRAAMTPHTRRRENIRGALRGESPRTREGRRPDRPKQQRPGTAGGDALPSNARTAGFAHTRPGRHAARRRKAGIAHARWRCDGLPVAKGCIRTHIWRRVEWCQGGVAGGVPPHKGGPKARPSKRIQEKVFLHSDRERGVDRPRRHRYPRDRNLYANSGLHPFHGQVLTKSGSTCQDRSAKPDPPGLSLLRALCLGDGWRGLAQLLEFGDCREARGEPGGSTVPAPFFAAVRPARTETVAADQLSQRNGTEG